MQIIYRTVDGKEYANSMDAEAWEAKYLEKQAFKGKLMVVLGINEPKDYTFKELWTDLYANRTKITFSV